MKISQALKLNKKQIEKMSDILSDVGLVALASVVIPALLDKFNIFTVVLGLLVAFVCWIASLYLRK